MYQWEVDCRPESVRSDLGSYITLSDYLEISFLASESPLSGTPTPFAGFDAPWRPGDQLRVEIAGIETDLVRGKEVAMVTEEGEEDYRHIWIASITTEDSTIRFRYQTRIFGTPSCMYTYGTSDEEIFLHILETFELTE